MDALSSNNTQNEIRSALEKFVIENSDLERLEDALSEINLFEALGAVRSELRHSDFLAFMLDPSQNHGLGDLIFKRIAQHAVAAMPDLVGLPNAVDLDGWDLDDTLVWREQDNIDLLLVNERLNFLLVIENKLGSKEHSDQLGRYKRVIEARYPHYRKVFLFLTLDGDIPSDPSYIPITHEKICAVVERVLESRASRLGQDVVILLRHYTKMLRRHHMEDAELARLARSIYQKHKRALDYIFDQRPDLQAWISETLKTAIEAQPELASDRASKGFIDFVLREWCDVPALNGSRGWTNTGRVLMFEFKNDGTRLQLGLIIGPGISDGHEVMRQKIFDAAITNPGIFKPSSKTLSPKWSQIWARNLLSKQDIEETDAESLKDKLEKEWQKFLHKELPPIKEALAKLW